MIGFKTFAQDYPTLGATAVIGGFHIFVTGVIIEARLFLGKEMPDGYDFWLLFLGALATGTFAAMVGKRLSDFRYKQAGTSPVTVEAPSNVTVETQAAKPVLTREDAQRAAEVYAGEDEAVG